MRHTITQLHALADLAKEHGDVITYPAVPDACEAFAGEHLFVVEHCGETVCIGNCGDLDVSGLVA
jgi:hypothetical protein